MNKVLQICLMLLFSVSVYAQNNWDLVWSMNQLPFRAPEVASEMAIVKAGFDTDETKAKIGAASQKNWDNPEFKQRELDKRATPEARKKHSNSAKKMWAKSDNTRSANLIQRNAKIYIVTFPDDHTEIVINLKKFCIEHELSYGAAFASMKRGGVHKSFKILPNI